MVDFNGTRYEFSSRRNDIVVDGLASAVKMQARLLGKCSPLDAQTNTVLYAAKESLITCFDATLMHDVDGG